MSRRFFIYARKSTDDASRQLRSIDDQIAELHELAVREQITVVDLLTEKQSAKKPGRPVFNQMLDRICAGEACGILAWHPDRLARNSLDGGKIIWLLDTGKLTDLKFSIVPFDNTASGKFLLGMMFSQSKYYVDNLSENIKRGLRQKLRNGVIPNALPIGYVRNKTDKTAIVDPVRGPLVRKAFELYATGSYTTETLTEVLSDLGLRSRPTKHSLVEKPLSRSGLHDLLSDPTYYGLIPYGAEVFEGKHEPLITKELFDQVQAALADRSRGKNKSKMKAFRYRGLLHCGECGGGITMQITKGHVYLRCTKRLKQGCSQRYLREEKLDAAILNAIVDLAVPEDVCDAVIADLENTRHAESGHAQLEKAAFEAEMRGFDATCERLTEAYLASVLTIDEFRKEKETILKRKHASREKFEKKQRQDKDRFEPAIEWLKTLKISHKMAKPSASVSQRLEYFKKFGSNPILTDRKLTFTPRGAWELVTGQGDFAHPFSAAAWAAAEKCGETHLIAFKWT